MAPGKIPSPPATTVLAVDPGRDKCGVAVVRPGSVLYREVLSRKDLLDRVSSLAGRYGVQAIVVGDATGSDSVVQELGRLGKPLHLVSERGTTVEARRRYFRENPPRGLSRLLPEGLRVPPRPWDDYVAVLLAERFLEAERARGLTGDAGSP